MRRALTRLRPAPSPSSPSRNGRPPKLHRALMVAAGVPPPTASGAPPLPSETYKRRSPRTSPTRTAHPSSPSPGAPPHHEAEPELCPRRRSPPPTPLLPLRAARWNPLAPLFILVPFPFCFVPDSAVLACDGEPPASPPPPGRQAAVAYRLHSPTAVRSPSNGPHPPRPPSQTTAYRSTKAAAGNFSKEPLSFL
jgi:hypothetical protein